MRLNPATQSFGTLSPTADRRTAACVGVRYASLRDKVTDEIRNAIVSGHYRQGKRLIEGQPAAEFAVSRNLIRAAPRTFVSEGHIDMTARHGAVVASFQYTASGSAPQKHCTRQRRMLATSDDGFAAR